TYYALEADKDSSAVIVASVIGNFPKNNHSQKVPLQTGPTQLLSSLRTLCALGVSAFMFGFP
ncbi:MAG TPA: hypothetical protein PKZ01_11805, partial [Candidatus Hydrogenedentes bacterium]|nr:hypothetical protein [Candidatus Hydrogenedentota bacterium]